MNLDFKAFPNSEPFFIFSEAFQTYHHPICLSCWDKALFEFVFDVFIGKVKRSHKNPIA